MVRCTTIRGTFSSAAVDTMDRYNFNSDWAWPAWMLCLIHVIHKYYLCSVRQAECPLRIWLGATRCEQLRRSTAGLSRSLNPTDPKRPGGSYLIQAAQSQSNVLVWTDSGQ